MGLLFNLSCLICISFGESRGLLAPQKKGAAPVKNATVAKTAAKTTDDDEDEMMPPMEAFESVDNDVDSDADKQELEAEEEDLHSHHPGRMFGLHDKGEKGTVSKNSHDKVDPMNAVHSHRLGSLGETPRKPVKAVPAALKKAQAPAKAESHLSHLKDLVGADEEPPQPVTKPVEAKPANKTEGTAYSNAADRVEKMKAQWQEKQAEVPVSSETAAQVEKMVQQEKARRNHTATTKAEAPKPAPFKKPHNLGKDLEEVSAREMAPLDQEVVAKLKAAMPSPTKKPAPHPAATTHEHDHGDVFGRLHAHAQQAAQTTTTTTTAAPHPRRATPQQLAEARRASSLTDALRNVNASDVELNLDVSEEAAKKIRDLEAEKKAKAEQVDKALAAPADHMAELRATAEKELEKKVHHIEAKAAKKALKAAVKQESPLSKLAEDTGIDTTTVTTTTKAPVKTQAAVDPIKALHQRLHHDEPKKVEKPKPAPTPPVQQKAPEEEEEGIMSGLHHNKARDNLPPVLR